MSEIAVFGGSGFIGRSLVHALASSGHNVRVVSRRAHGSGLPSAVSVCAADVADAESVGRAARGAEIVFLLVTGGGERWADFERDVVRGTATVARACLDHGVRRLVYTSSIAALYLGAGGTIDESAGPDPRPSRRSLYSRAKIAAEEVIRTQPVPWVIFRPGLVMGREGVLNHAGLGLWPSDICCIGWGTGTNPLPFVLVDDVARALVAAIDAPVTGQTFNLAGDVFLSARECIAIIAEQSLRRVTFYPTPPLRAYAIDIAKWLIKVAARKPENDFPSLREQRSNALLTQLDSSNARRHLGWRPNADRDVFVREALMSHLAPIPPGDLRSSPPLYDT